MNAKKENEALEKRIAAALAATDMTADVIADLVAEAEEAMIAADEAVEAEYERAHDVLISPDADKAREALQLAEFRRDRLRTALTQLKARCAQVAAAEDAAKWEADYESPQGRARCACAGVFPALFRAFRPARDFLSPRGQPSIRNVNALTARRARASIGACLGLS